MERGLGLMHGEAPKRDVWKNGLRPAAELAADKPHGTRIKYMGGCRCVPCRAANSRYNSECEKRKKRGEGNGIVDGTPVIEHLRKLSEQGVGYKAVCEAAGIGNTCVQRLLFQGKRTLRAGNARAILAVTPAMAIRDGALISAKPTWKLIAWLKNEGISEGEIAIRLGYKTRNLQLNKHVITARNAMKVQKLVNLMRLGE